jgi:hemerythrin
VALLKFKDAYRTGVGSIDHEHEELIDLINELHGVLQAKEDKAEVEDVLGELHGKIGSHFALEEKVMRDMGYGEVDDHTEEHNKLLSEILDIADAVHHDENYDYMTRLEKEVQSWFTVHFAGMDARLNKILAAAANG